MDCKPWARASSLISFLVFAAGCGEDERDRCTGDCEPLGAQHAVAGSGSHAPQLPQASGNRSGSGGSHGGAGSRAGNGSPASVGAHEGEAGEMGSDSDAGVDRERYESVGTNPFVLTAHDPFSTFAADVDTASYDIFRRDVTLGVLPDPASVRLEEFVNYFDYAYPQPAADAEHPFAIALAMGPGSTARRTALMRVGIQAKDPPPFQKKPAHVVFLVDVSGSMQTAEKLPVVQHLLTHALEVLDADDRVSIVTYASGVAVRLPPTLVARKDEIAAVISSLTAGGSTNGAGGIDLAYAQAQQAFIEDGINHVVLCTDGDFNVGASSDEALLALIEQKRASGVTLTALGFGFGNLNDSMMEKVSNAGNGIYSVMTSRTQAENYAEERLLATVVHVAKDLKIQVEFNPAGVRAYRLLGYENRAIADVDFRNDVVDAGEVGAGHRVTALYELVLADEALPEVEAAPDPEDGSPVNGAREVAAEDLVLVKVRYKTPGATDAEPATEVSTALARSEASSDVGQLDDDTRFATAVAAFAEILKHSPYAEPAELSALRAVFQSQRGRDRDREEFFALFERAAARLAP